MPGHFLEIFQLAKLIQFVLLSDVYGQTVEYLENYFRIILIIIGHKVMTHQTISCVCPSGSMQEILQLAKLIQFVLLSDVYGQTVEYLENYFRIILIIIGHKVMTHQTISCVCPSGSMQEILQLAKLILLSDGYGQTVENYFRLIRSNCYCFLWVSCDCVFGVFLA